MSDQIHVVPAHLREAAGHHQEASDYLRAVPSTHEAIQASVDSFGPIYGGVIDAVRELLEQRKQCYDQQASDHADMSHNLNRSADHWEHQDDTAARQLGGVLDGGG